MSSGPVRCTRIVAIARRTMPAMSAEHHAPPAPGPYLQTVSGRWVNPFDPDPEQLDIGDIARALANQCRFGGHCRVFYSVAQHSVIVSRARRGARGRRRGRLRRADARRERGLPRRHAAPDQAPQPARRRVQGGRGPPRAGAPQRFGIRPDVPEIKRADRALLATERRAFSAEGWHWPELDGRRAARPRARRRGRPTRLEQAFVERYGELAAQR